MRNVTGLPILQISTIPLSVRKHAIPTAQVIPIPTGPRSLAVRRTILPKPQNTTIIRESMKSAQLVCNGTESMV